MVNDVYRFGYIIVSALVTIHLHSSQLFSNVFYRIEILLNVVLIFLDSSFPEKHIFRIEKVVTTIHLALRDRKTGTNLVLTWHLLMHSIQLFSQREETSLLVFAVGLLHAADSTEFAHIATWHEENFIDILLLGLVVQVALVRFNG